MLRTVGFKASVFRLTVRFRVSDLGLDSGLVINEVEGFSASRRSILTGRRIDTGACKVD